MYRSSPLHSTLNTNVITGLDMCKVCTEADNSVALGTWKPKNVKTLPGFRAVGKSELTLLSGTSCLISKKKHVLNIWPFGIRDMGPGKLNDSNIEARDSCMPENGPANLIHESMPGSLPGRHPTSKNMVLPDASLSKSMSKSAKIYLWHSEDVAEHCSTS